MVSLLTMILNTVTSVILYALKAFFSLVTWFLKSFFRLIKLLYVALPATCIAFVLLFLASIIMLFTGPLPVMEAVPVIDIGRNATPVIFSELHSWWLTNVYSYRGNAAYIPLLIITVLMFIPVVCVFLCISVIVSFGNALFIAVVVDAVLYLARAIMGQSFVSQALGRYWRLFPDAGRKHEEKQYDKWLKKKNREFEEEDRDRRRDKRNSFYEDDEYGDGYEEDFEEDYEDDFEDPDEYYEDEEDYYEDEEFEDDEEYYEDEAYDEDYEEDFEDDYDDPRSGKSPAPTTFDFFAGCSSRESVDKKYKSLVKLYHPDNMDGDTAALQEINAQYAEAKKRFQ